MESLQVPVANFTISDNAKRGIEAVRQWFDPHWPDPADVATIGWVRVLPNEGEPYETVAVTFYSRSQRSEIAEAIQIISGIEVVYLPVAKDHARFEGKVLDWTSERNFFLRAP